MKTTENEQKYNLEILELVKEFILLGYKNNSSTNLEDEMLNSLKLKDLNISNEDYECLEELFSNSTFTEEKILSILKK